MNQREFRRVERLADIKLAIDAYLDFELGEPEDDDAAPVLTLESLRDLAVAYGERAFKAPALEDLFEASQAHVNRNLNRLLELGVIERRGGGRNTRYRYSPKTDPGHGAVIDAMRNRKRPEDEAVETNGHLKPHRGAPISGLAGVNVGNKEMQEVIDACQRAGWVAESGAKHVKVKVPSGRTITLPKTPSDHRSIKNTKAQLRAEGLQV